MDIQVLALRWLHILCAIGLVGGVFFWRFALAPALAALDDVQRQQVHDAVRPRWARIVMITSAILLVSGLWNAVANIRQYEFDGGAYHALVGVKLLLALAIMFIAAKLSGRSESAERFREKQLSWLTINAILAVVLVCSAGVMKVMPHITKDRSTEVDQDQAPIDLEIELPPSN